MPKKKAARKKQKPPTTPQRGAKKRSKAKEPPYHVVILDALLGEIRKYSYGYEFNVQANGFDHEVQFAAYINGPLTTGLLELMRSAAKNLAKLDREARETICREFLEIYNKSWRDETEPRLTAAKFKHRLRLKTVAFEHERHIDVWYADDDMFGGHSLYAFGEGPGKLKHANMFG